MKKKTQKKSFSTESCNSRDRCWSLPCT